MRSSTRFAAVFGAFLSLFACSSGSSRMKGQTTSKSASVTAPPADLSSGGGVAADAQAQTVAPTSSGAVALASLTCAAFQKELYVRWLGYNLYVDLANNVAIDDAINDLAQRVQLMADSGFGAEQIQDVEARWAFAASGEGAPSAVDAVAPRDRLSASLRDKVTISDQSCAYLRTPPAAATLALVDGTVPQGGQASYADGHSLLDAAFQAAQAAAKAKDDALAAANTQLAQANTCRFADASYAELVSCEYDKPNSDLGAWEFSAHDQTIENICQGRRIILSSQPTYFDGTNGTQPCGAHDKCFMWDYYELAHGYHSRHSVIIRNFDSSSCNLVFTREGTGCFHPDTRITLADGKTKPASEVAVGDRLLNPLTKKAVRVVQVVFGPEPTPLVEVGLGDGSLVRVTAKHPFLTGAGLKTAAQLKTGDTIFDAHGRVAKITVLRPGQAKTTRVWNFAVQGDGEADEQHMVIADGVAAGDLTLQRKLDKSAKAVALSGKH